jgi:hypothetical protein
MGLQPSEVVAASHHEGGLALLCKEKRPLLTLRSMLEEGAGGGSKALVKERTHI